MMLFFQSDWAGVYWGRRARDRTVVGLVCGALNSRAGDRTAAGLVYRFWMWHSSRRGLRPWPLRCLSQFLVREKIDCLEGECFSAYLSLMGWPGIYSICFS